MPGETTETQGGDGGEPARVEEGTTGEGVSAEHGADSPQVAPSGQRLTRNRKLLIGVLGASQGCLRCLSGVW
jgi:hypothetical protein